MKYESFDGRWDGEELSALLARDGIDIVIRFITESDYKIRVYYAGKVITYSFSDVYPFNNPGQMQQTPMHQLTINQQAINEPNTAAHGYNSLFSDIRNRMFRRDNNGE